MLLTTSYKTIILNAWTFTLLSKIFNLEEITAYQKQNVTKLQSRNVTESLWPIVAVLTTFLVVILSIFPMMANLYVCRN